MTTKFFSRWSDTLFFQVQLAEQSGIAYAIQVDFPDALISESTGNVRDIVVTDDEELVTVFRGKGYEINYIRGD